MRRRLVGLLAALALAAAPPALAATVRTVTAYVVSPHFSGPDLTGLDVAVMFEAGPGPETRLLLPDTVMGSSGLWRHISNLTVQGGAVTVTEDGPAVRVVRAKPGRLLTLRYTVSGTLDHEPRESDGYPVEPWVRPSWFYVDAASALAVVEGHEDSPVVFSWGPGWPKDFVLESNLNSLEGADPRPGVLIGGRDVRIIRDRAVRLALRGTFPFTDAELAQEVSAILGVERGFFGDAQDTPFLVTAQGLGIEDGSSFSGVGKQQAFAMALTPNLSLNDLRVLLAHEIFHTWNSPRLGQSTGPRGYWFSEGFTDFYARRLLMRERLITPQAFVALWNQALLAYGTSPFIALPGEDAAARFWTVPGADKLAYQRGALLAAIWDRRLRASGSSLDAVIHAQAARPDGAIVDTFIRAAKGKGLNVTPDIAAYIDQGRPIRLPADAFAPCATVTDVTAPDFDLGFEPRTDNKGQRTVAGLRQDSPAWRAGLREGAVILEKRQGVSGDSAQPYELVVRDGDGSPRTVSFLPQGSKTRTFQQLVLTPEAAKDPGLCDFQSRKTRQD